MTKRSATVKGLNGGDAAHMALAGREQGKRAAIAALYWRAGEYALIADEHPDSREANDDAAFTLARAADAMGRMLA